MARNSLAMYNVLVRKTEGAVGYTDLGNVGGVDFFDLVETFCINLRNRGMQSDDAIKRTFAVESMSADKSSRWIYGQLYKGDYGTRRPVYDTTTRQVSKTILETEVVPEPFYFGFYLPKTDPRGFLLLQRIGGVGVVGDFSKEMKANINKTVIPGYRFDLPSAVSERVIKELYASGRITKLTLIRYTSSGDIMEDMTPMEIKAELTIKPSKRNRALPLNEALTETRERGKTVSDVFGLKGVNFDYTEASAEIQGLGKKWTVDLTDFGNMLPYYELDSKVKFNPQGYPSLESVHQAAKDLVNDHLTGEAEE